jgi:hypothetical protein
VHCGSVACELGEICSIWFSCHSLIGVDSSYCSHWPEKVWVRIHLRPCVCFIVLAKRGSCRRMEMEIGVAYVVRGE